MTKAITQFCATEWAVLHAARDAERSGSGASAAAVTRRLPGLPGETVRRTRRRLAGWGLIRSDGTRTRSVSGEPYSGDDVTPAERAEIDDARQRVDDDRVSLAYGRLASAVGGFRESGPNVIRQKPPLDTILSIAPRLASAAACRLMVAAFPREYA